MGLLPDKDILWRATKREPFVSRSFQLEINPFAESSPPGVVSYGVSSYGYDVRLGTTFKLFDASACGVAVIDPHDFDLSAMRTVKVDPMIGIGSRFVLPPHSFALAESLEWLRIPRDCLGLVTDKSTLRRCGLLLGSTVLEPEWEGKITLELTNATPLPLILRSGEGIAQVLFLRGDTECLRSYADKRGRYQGQTGLTTPFVARVAERDESQGKGDLHVEDFDEELHERTLGADGE